jgi:hypothetical protein
VLQLSEVDVEINAIREQERPSRMIIATLMALKYNILKELMPYAYSKVPQEQNNNSENMTPVVINIDGKAIMDEEQALLKGVNEALEEAREAFPDYRPDKTTPVGAAWKLV